MRGVGPLPTRLPWASRGPSAGGTARPGRSACLGIQPRGRPLSWSELRANQNVLMPRRGMRVAGNQGQGPGHNGAIVGLQSVDFQAAVSSTLAPSPHPRPLPGSHPNLRPPFSLCAKEAALGILSQTGEAGSARAWSVTSTRWRQSTALPRAGREPGGRPLSHRRVRRPCPSH